MKIRFKTLFVLAILLTLIVIGASAEGGTFNGLSWEYKDLN